MARKVLDCRDHPESNCTMTFAGEETELEQATVQHAVSVHGYEDNPELRKELRGMWRDEHDTGAKRDLMKHQDLGEARH